MGSAFHDLIFFVFAALTVASAVCVLMMNNLLHAAVSLFFSLTGVAALYLIMGADFLGVTQLLVYAGGILVLLIFGIFLTARLHESSVEFKERPVIWSVGIGIAFATFAAISSVISSQAWVTKTPEYVSTTSKLGELFLSKYLLPFELISLLLLMAMIGSVLLVKKEIEEN